MGPTQGALQQGDPEGLFQTAQLFAHGRLRTAQFASCSRHTALVRYLSQQHQCSRKSMPAGGDLEGRPFGPM
jgi:hypothetical protein